MDLNNFLVEFSDLSAITPYRYVKAGWIVKGPRLFRYTESQFGEDEAQLNLEVYPIEKITRCGYWISIYGKRKFVLKADGSGRKRWAYTDPVLAMESYLIRKDHHIIHLKRKLRIAVNARKQARKLCPVFTSILNLSERSI